MHLSRITIDDISAYVKKAQQVGGDAYSNRTEEDVIIAGMVDPDGKPLELLQEKA